MDYLINIPETVVAEPIVFNYPETKERLTAILNEYRGIEVTAETLSSCKKKQKEMASLRGDLDKTRLEVKRNYQKPLEIFEDQVKSLIAMIQEVEKPLKDNIDTFDRVTREKNRELAKKIAAELVEAEGLTEEFARQIEMKSRFSNLTIKEQEIRSDLEMQVAILKEKQDNAEATKAAIEKAVEHENKDLTAKMKPEWFLSLLDKMPAAEIVSSIIVRAGEIRKAEAEAKARAEAEAKAKEQAKAEADQVEAEPMQEIVEEAQEDQSEDPAGEPEPPIEENRPLYKVTFVVVGTQEQQERLSKFLKENDYSYNVESQYEL